MLRFFSINNGGGGTGTELWQFRGGVTPDDIDLNTAEGVEGIDAECPANTDYALLLTNKLGPDVVAGFAGFGAAKEVNNIIIDNGAGAIAVKQSVSVPTDSEAASIEILSAGVTKDITDRTGNNIYEFVETPFIATQTITDVATEEHTDVQIIAGGLQVHSEDGTTGDYTRYNIDKDNFGFFSGNAGGVRGGAFLQNQNGTAISYTDPATNVRLFDMNITGDKMQVLTPGTNNAVLRFMATGAIQTNQTAPSAAVRLKVAELPIYDIAGALVGYIEVKQ